MAKEPIKRPETEGDGPLAQLAEQRAFNPRLHRAVPNTSAANPLNAGIFDRFWSKVSVSNPGECWPWLGSKRRRGYGQFFRAGRNESAHRVALELSAGVTLRSDAYVCHRCDNPACCNPSHLFEGDAKTNARDMIAKGRHHDQRGEAHHSAKLTDAEVRDLREMRANGHRVCDLAKLYRVTTGYVRELVELKKRACPEAFRTSLESHSKGILHPRRPTFGQDFFGNRDRNPGRVELVSSSDSTCGGGGSLRRSRM